MDYKFSLILSVLLALVLSYSGYSETTGAINFSTKNESITTGLFSYTVSSCSSNSDCFEYTCFFDYDTAGPNTTTSGTCAPASFTSCIHDTSAGAATITSTGQIVCISNTTYRECTSGSWSSLQNCPSGTTCVGGSSACSSSSSSSSGGSAGSPSASTTGKLEITSSPQSLEIVQGNSSKTSVAVKNTGAITLINITLSVSGIENSWYSYVPSQFLLRPTNSNQFNITYSIPQDAEVNTYSLTFKATAKDGTTASAAATLKIIPSPDTAMAINQTLEDYTDIYRGIQDNISAMQNTNVSQSDAESLRSIASDIEIKLNQSSEAIAKGDYFNAKLLLDEAKTLIDRFNARSGEVRFLEPNHTLSGENMTSTGPIIKDNTIIFVIAGIVIAAIAVILYLFWPSKRHKLFANTIL